MNDASIASSGKTKASLDANGSVILTDIYSEGEYAEIDCRSLAYKIYKNKNIVKDGIRSFCKNEEGKWDFDE